MPRASRVRSYVWEHFEVVEENEEAQKLKCKNCGLVLNLRPKCGTGSLRRHIKSCLERTPEIRILS